MLTIKSKAPIKKEIDYNILSENYNKVNFDNFDFNTNIDNLKDVGLGANILLDSISKNLHICIVTDYDVDGISSAVVLTKGIKNILKHKNTTTVVNKRIYGNGFNPRIVRKILDINSDKKIDLIITADHGSNDDEYYIELKNKIKDLKIILTDHHTISKYPKNVDAFINPMREDSTYDKSISGCCTAFLLLVKTFELLNKPFLQLYELVPFVGMSTVTDCMDMNVPYNQFIVELALRIINSERFLYWHIFKIKLGTGIVMTIRDFGFNIGPVVNCGNALNSEELIFNMLMETDLDKLTVLIAQALELNKMRKELTKKYSKVIEENYDFNNTSTIVDMVDIKEEAIINGKIAASIGSSYNRPTIIFGNNKTNIIHGSGRGIVEGFNILNIINKINDKDNTILNNFGGHYGALGCSIYKDKLDTFKLLFDKYSKLELKEDVNILNTDMYVPHKQINIKLFEEQEKYGPYGQYRQPPTYFTIMTVSRINTFGPIAKFQFVQANNKLDGIYFFNDVTVTKKNIDSFKDKLCYIAFNLELTRFRGSYSLNIVVRRIEVIR